MAHGVAALATRRLTARSATSPRPLQLTAQPSPRPAAPTQIPGDHFFAATGSADIRLSPYPPAYLW
ncbi:MAG: hypothetical protein ACK443_02685, partial [Methylococcaceae bacterium]